MNLVIFAVLVLFTVSERTNSYADEEADLKSIHQLLDTIKEERLESKREREDDRTRHQRLLDDITAENRRTIKTLKDMIQSRNDEIECLKKALEDLKQRFDQMIESKDAEIKKLEQLLKKSEKRRETEIQQMENLIYKKVQDAVNEAKKEWQAHEDQVKKEHVEEKEKWEALMKEKIEATLAAEGLKAKFDENGSFFSEFADFFDRQPTEVKIAIVVGGVAVIGVTGCVIVKTGIVQVGAKLVPQYAGLVAKIASRWIPKGAVGRILRAVAAGAA